MLWKDQFHVKKKQNKTQNRYMHIYTNGLLKSGNVDVDAGFSKRIMKEEEVRSSEEHNLIAATGSPKSSRCGKKGSCWISSTAQSAVEFWILGLPPTAKEPSRKSWNFFPWVLGFEFESQQCEASSKKKGKNCLILLHIAVSVWWKFSTQSASQLISLS